MVIGDERASVASAGRQQRRVTGWLWAWSATMRWSPLSQITPFDEG
jgi:hypothetical protein